MIARTSALDLVPIADCDQLELATQSLKKHGLSLHERHSNGLIDQMVVHPPSTLIK